ncbi:hypothetical protein TTRE_0000651201 [Trichuris trichiura]|uniref:Transmembrane protein n=1 Tax=Trichuris trichiura TaxID=36087 RepID=A0A077ZCX2_TRITR|nr:hypothetical protein TTRE_0000651201 [Trichuris trichiura]
MAIDGPLLEKIVTLTSALCLIVIGTLQVCLYLHARTIDATLFKWTSSLWCGLLTTVASTIAIFQNVGNCVLFRLPVWVTFCVVWTIQWAAWLINETAEWWTRETYSRFSPQYDYIYCSSLAFHFIALLSSSFSLQVLYLSTTRWSRYSRQIHLTSTPSQNMSFSKSWRFQNAEASTIDIDAVDRERNNRICGRYRYRKHRS